MPALLIAQDDTDQDRPAQEESNDLKFSDVEVEIESEGNTESEQENTYRTLEIRYTTQEVPKEANKINIHGHEFRCFDSKKSAITFYQMIKEKQDTPDYLIYYVMNEKQKKPEVYTFRVD